MALVFGVPWPEIAHDTGNWGAMAHGTGIWRAMAHGTPHLDDGTILFVDGTIHNS